MFELNRLHSQALVRFDHRKLAMSLLGGAGESRNDRLLQRRIDPCSNFRSKKSVDCYEMHHSPVSVNATFHSLTVPS